ncbi:hypothetical protein [Ligilactobacillus ceti]|uniref:Uncharacterized protein n=1 Tax=Ligilactobacillus ceti DSM 22408 TaxID=1122146 RepID=A0A0R2KJ60_9LACO|nr:hypothetical protein [Ligilactobacillus ceti]KRN89411.1 hypothetical protein IV53_GL000129 [Ligilactobacillus ceti DSM 22408]
MSENVFFNPGNSIASDYDYQKAYISAQVYHKKAQQPVLIVQEKDGHPYIVFDEKTALKQEEQVATRYQNIARVDHHNDL